MIKSKFVLATILSLCATHLNAQADILANLEGSYTGVDGDNAGSQPCAVIIELSDDSEMLLADASIQGFHSVQPFVGVVEGLRAALVLNSLAKIKLMRTGMFEVDTIEFNRSREDLELQSVKVQSASLNRWPKSFVCKNLVRVN